MISTFTALVDANVFYSARLRSLILFQAQAGGFRARWTRKINEEWLENLLLNRPDLDRQKLSRTREAMNAAVLDCIVCGYCGLIEGLTLPDRDDRHVLAAAIVAHANVIVTFNVKHFPNQTLSEYGIHAKHPDEFLLDLASVSQDEFIKSAKKDFYHYKRPRIEFSHYIDSLQRSGIPKTAEHLEKFKVLFDIEQDSKSHDPLR